MPRTRITDRWLRGHHPEAREEWTDSVIPGLLVRFGTGAPVFYARYREGGRYRRVKIGAFPGVSLVDARDRARALSLSRQRRDQPEATVEPGSFADLVTAFLRHRKAKKEAGLAEVERMLKRDVLPVIGSRPAASIRPRDIAAILDAAVERGAPTQANRLRAHLIRVFRYGMERERCEINPALMLSKPHKEKPRERVLSGDEIAALWRELELRHPTPRNLFRFLLLTGLRPGEARLLTWQDVDSQQILVPAERMKARREHRLPLPDLAHRILESQRDLCLPGALVFPSTLHADRPYDQSSLSHTARKLGAKLGFAFRPQDLRKTCASGLAALGVPEEVRQRILAHTPRSVTNRVYNVHQYEAEVREALDEWARTIQALLAERQSRRPAIHS